MPSGLVSPSYILNGFFCVRILHRTDRFWYIVYFLFHIALPGEKKARRSELVSIQE
jgi:hypothetical protein